MDGEGPAHTKHSNISFCRNSHAPCLSFVNLLCFFKEKYILPIFKLSLSKYSVINTISVFIIIFAGVIMITHNWEAKAELPP